MISGGTPIDSPIGGLDSPRIPVLFDHVRLTRWIKYMVNICKYHIIMVIHDQYMVTVLISFFEFVG